MDLLTPHTVVFAHSTLESKLIQMLCTLRRDSDNRAKLIEEYRITDVEATCQLIRDILDKTIVLGC